MADVSAAKMVFMAQIARSVVLDTVRITDVIWRTASAWNARMDGTVDSCVTKDVCQHAEDHVSVLLATVISVLTASSGTSASKDVPLIAPKPAI